MNMKLSFKLIAAGLFVGIVSPIFENPHTGGSVSDPIMGLLIIIAVSLIGLGTILEALHI